MGQHENWFETTSRNVNIQRNKKAKVSAVSFGDDSGGTFSNQGQGATLINTQAIAAPTAALNPGGGSGTFAEVKTESLTNSQSAPVPVPTTLFTDPLGTVAAVVVDAASQVVAAAGQPAEALQTGAALAGQGASGPALAAGLATAGQAGQTAFNTGVALVNGAAKAIPPAGMSPQGQAGYLIAHGIVGAPPEVKGAIASVIAQSPVAKAGLIAGMAVVRKTWWRKLLDWLHL
jgi:hypothetical protein